MKYKVIIEKEEEIIFEGKPLDLPIDQDLLKHKSIEVFNDANPCIIHQTYIIEIFMDQMLTFLKMHLNEKIKIEENMAVFDFIDIKHKKDCQITLRGK